MFHIPLSGGPSPPSGEMELLGCELTDGALRVVQNVDRTIGADLIKLADGAQLVLASVKTSPVSPKDGDVFILGIVWKRGSLKVYIDGKLVASTDPAAELASDKDLRSLPQASKQVNYSWSNKDAQFKRKGRVAGTHPMPGRIPGGQARDFNDLRDELAQVNDLIALLRDGRAHHAKGLARAIRKLLVGTNGHIGVLQRCAGRIEAPLTLYVGHAAALNLDDFAPSEEWITDVSPVQTPRSPNAVDVDVWLGLKAGRLHGKHVTNADAIKAIGHTVAAHGDPDIHPIVEANESVRMLGGKILWPDYILTVGIAIAGVAERLLSEYDSRS